MKIKQKQEVGKKIIETVKKNKEKSRKLKLECCKPRSMSSYTSRLMREDKHQGIESKATATI
ncbi:MAG: hypothetical protein ACXWWC_13660 [Chitinophagaceae bacterium]